MQVITYVGAKRLTGNEPPPDAGVTYVYDHRGALTIGAPPDPPPNETEDGQTSS